MKRLLVILFVLFCVSAFGQYPNEWIDYSQKYYRIPITNAGIYKITYADLVSNGISVGDFDHRNLQIVHDGKVIPLFVSAQPDGIFRNTDYIEFYAEGGNTGWQDSKLYYTGRSFNENVSLYNDTAAYFLTIANTLTSPRYDTIRATNYNEYAPLTYCLRTVRGNYTSTFNATKSSPYILPSEGWCDSYFDMGGNVEKGLITANYASVDVPSVISFGIGGFSETQHDVVVTLESDESVRFDTTYFDYNAIHKTLTVSSPLPASTVLKFQSISGDKTADKNSVSYLQVTYPSTFNFGNQSYFEFTLPAVDLSDYLLIEVSNFNAGSAAPVVYVPDLGKRILATLSNGKYYALIPNAHKEIKCIMTSQNTMKRVSEIVPVTSKNAKQKLQFLDFSQPENQGDYIIITEKKLWQEATYYKQYRASTGYQVVLVDVDELYNQFAYGVRKHPVAISNFIAYAVKTWSIKPKHVFIIGKGFHVANFRKNEALYQRTLVPSMGNPSSDLLFTLDMRGRNLSPNIAVGRIAAETPEEVAIYRNKVKDFEAQELAPWMKNVLHFGGGATAYEQSLFRYYLKQYERTLSGMYFGANVHSFYKESSDVYETTEPEAIRKYMNEGVSLMTFFGHASGSGFDQSIDHPSLFNNQGRYPLILANSCYSGDIFTESDYNVSCTWIFEKNRGAIGFLANVDVGMPTYLNVFSSALVRNLAYTNYGKSIGENVAKTLSDVSARNLVYEDLYEGIVGFTLHGDPAIKLHSFDKPDFAIDETSIAFSPTLITTDLESAQCNVAIKNNGRAYSSSYAIRATFTSETGDAYRIDTLINGCYNVDTISLALNMKKFVSGEYTVRVEVDYDDEIEELSEDNNSAEVPFFVSSRELMPVYPSNYAIIPTDTISLIMSAVDAFNPPTEIKVELDTCVSYDSPLKQSVVIPVNGNAVISWKPEGHFIDSTTYFWRVTATDSIKWNEYSFTYEKNRSGWGQIHAHQFVDNKISGMNYNDTTKKYSFKTIPHEVTLQTRGNCSTNKEYYECTFVLDATQMENSGFPLSSPALHVIVLDSASMEPWLSSRAPYGQRNYPSANGRVRYHLAFTSNNATSQKNLANFLNDTVPEGNYILCYSFKNPYCQSWDASLKTAMENLGFTKYKTTPDNYPYIFFTQKGNPASCEEVVGNSETALISMTKVLTANVSSGRIRTANIGPAKKFEEMQWESITTDNDVSYLTYYGVTKNNYVYALQNEFKKERKQLDTIVNAEYFPYMQLDCYMSDDERTPADLNFWKVYYTPAAELAVSPEYAFSFYHDTLQQGDMAQIVSSAKNIVGTAMDSVLVMYEIRNEQNEVEYLQYKRICGVEPYGYVVDTQFVSTNFMHGRYSLKIEYNPVNPETGEYDQPEEIHFNNVYYYSFVVTTDQTAPILDVVIDGRHVMNGDNVSASPEIVILLFDENPFFSLQDTALFSIYVVNTQTNEKITYYFADSVLRFIPANDTSNIAHVYFTPTLSEAGTYELHVQAKDASGNATASQEYSVQFEVDLEPKVSILYNYPNPCAEFTTFRFILTGKEKPQNLAIQISDVKGHVVKTIHINNAHIGTNNVDIYWDGRDNAGGYLPNGVYFYQLTFDGKSDWETLRLKQTDGLNKNTGRLVIRR